MRTYNKLALLLLVMFSMAFFNCSGGGDSGEDAGANNTNAHEDEGVTTASFNDDKICDLISISELANTCKIKAPDIPGVVTLDDKFTASLKDITSSVEKKADETACRYKGTLILKPAAPYLPPGEIKDHEILSLIHTTSSAAYDNSKMFKVKDIPGLGEEAFLANFTVAKAVLVKKGGQYFSATVLSKMCAEEDLISLMKLALTRS